MSTQNKYRVLIADDEALARDSIRILVEKTDDCSVVAETTNGQETMLKILQKEPDIVFLDIQMPHLTGTEVIESISPSKLPAFIFVTAYDQYATKAFDLEAVDYLLKPYSDTRFYQSLNRAKKQAGFSNFLEGKESKRPYNFREQFLIKSTGKIELVAVSEIIFIKSSGNYVELYTPERKYLLRATIGETEMQLDPKVFARIHRSTIIRKSEIKELQSHYNGEFIVIMKNGDVLKLSRSYKHNLESIIGTD